VRGGRTTAWEAVQFFNKSLGEWSKPKKKKRKKKQKKPKKKKKKRSTKYLGPLVVSRLRGQADKKQISIKQRGEKRGGSGEEPGTRQKAKTSVSLGKNHTSRVKCAQGGNKGSKPARKKDR